MLDECPDRKERWSVRRRTRRSHPAGPQKGRRHAARHAENSGEGGAGCCVTRSFPVKMSMGAERHARRHLVTCTDRPAAARSTVDALTFCAVTRTLLLDQTWQSSTKAMLLVSRDASAKSPRRARGTVTSMFAVAPAVRLGRFHVVSSARLRVTVRQIRHCP
jgi:hypothetical protein